MPFLWQSKGYTLVPRGALRLPRVGRNVLFGLFVLGIEKDAASQEPKEETKFFLAKR